MSISLPCLHVRMIPVDDVHPNDWNPNVVPETEMGLLERSIRETGWTLPIVVTEVESGQYRIVDGFHRWLLARTALREELGGRVPAVVVSGTEADHIAATVRHNRARGMHCVLPTIDLVCRLRDLGLGEEDIARRLGMTQAEVARILFPGGLVEALKEEIRDRWSKALVPVDARRREES